MEGIPVYDLFIIGGGINGVGVARDAAGRGYSVRLAEMNDLASATSSGSTKLIHGGLRYLEHYEFGLVRESLREREILWRNAPHIVRPMRFILPHHSALRPAWLLRLGLFLYDHIGGRRLLPATRTLDLRRDSSGKPLQRRYRRAFEYSDCWVDDARLVVLNARDAADRGADIRTRTRVEAAWVDDGFWSIRSRDERTGRTDLVRARYLLNAAGPWVDRVADIMEADMGEASVRLVKGSHIVTRRLFSGDRAYIFQNGDGRIVFAIPYERDFTLIGTTDKDFDGDPSTVTIDDSEIDYLCGAVSTYLKEQVTPGDVVSTYAAVRPLYDDGASKAQEATRDYVLKPGRAEGAPFLHIFGGKITTYRRLAEEILEDIERALGEKSAAWTHDAPLPGGGFSVDAFEAQLEQLLGDYPFLNRDHALRLLRQYGTLAHGVLGMADSTAALGQHFGSDLYEIELRFLIEREWAQSAADVLWRRTKCGLKLTPDEAEAVADFMRECMVNSDVSGDAAKSGEQAR